MFQKITAWFQGRHTMYVCGAITLGTFMALIGKLDANYVHLLLGFGLLVFGHSLKEDLVN